MASEAWSSGARDRIASPSPCPRWVGVVCNERIHAGSIVLEVLQGRDLVTLSPHRLDEHVSDLGGRRRAAQNVAKRSRRWHRRRRLVHQSGDERLIVLYEHRAMLQSGAGVTPLR